MKNLVEGVLNNNHNIKIKSFLGDAAYDGNSHLGITKYGIKKCNYKQKITINGKRKESMWTTMEG